MNDKENTRNSVRQANSGSDPIQTPSPDVQQARHIDERTLRDRRAGTPPASKVPPQNTEKSGPGVGRLVILAVLIIVLLLLWEMLAGAGYLSAGAGASAKFLLDQFNALDGRTILRFWRHLAVILCSTLLPPLFAVLAGKALFRESRAIMDQAGEAVHTAAGILSLCGVILRGVLKAFIHPPRDAAPEKPAEVIPMEETFEDPLFPDDLSGDIRKAMGPAERTKIKK